ncbi:olfactory receptor 1B1-like [Pan troglodytes]|uniref:olfactory receptor 1B1-like n=1 Tax=Pan troglodytes TaxID=9598 RepID=UPI0023F0DDF4|nr:olfactory receptor 1B1-like [Pan troglodytes]
MYLSPFRQKHGGKSIRREDLSDILKRGVSSGSGSSQARSAVPAAAPEIQPGPARAAGEEGRGMRPPGAGRRLPGPPLPGPEASHSGQLPLMPLARALDWVPRSRTSEDPERQLVLAGLFLSICLVTVLGNLLIILAVSPDSHLRTPMYFSLSNLSLPDISFTSTTVPKMIVDIQSHSRVISYAGYLTQMSLFAIFGGMKERHAPECDGL